MILVSGGTGLVGAHVLFDLCKSGKQVRALKRADSSILNVKKVFSLSSENADELLNNIEWVETDILDTQGLTRAMEGISQVYHCAAMVSFDPEKEAEMTNVNIEGTANMVNVALEKGVKKFAHISSIAALGTAPRGELTTEETPWKWSPEYSNYAISKYSAEREVWRASNEGLDVVIVNPSLIIGAGNWQQSSSNIFTKSYKGIKFFTDGSTGFIDVRDVSALMIQLMNSEIKNERYIINAENIPYKLLFDKIHKEFNKPTPSIKAGKFLSAFAWRAEKIRCFMSGETPLITKETAQSAHKTNSYSNKKIVEAFPAYQFIPIEQSIKETCQLFLSDLK